MVLDGASFLEAEREAWRPFEALGSLDDPALETPVAAAHGWRGRDLMAHLLSGHATAIEIARELAVGEESETLTRTDEEWDRLGGDAVNARIEAEWSLLPLDEIRARFRQMPGELRGLLKVLPDARWIEHPAHRRAFLGETLEHYADHRADLAAVLAAAS
jgi:hypothetical protein